MRSKQITLHSLYWKYREKEFAERRFPNMVSWTPEDNMFLSCLLDDVTGTEEIVATRKDCCKINDCLMSCNGDNFNIYFTGSKAEGLDLPGSGRDTMFDINNVHDIVVSDSIQDLVQSTRTNKLLVDTDDVPPGFVLLKIYEARTTVKISDDSYFSSQHYPPGLLPILDKSDLCTRKIQGPYTGL